MFETAATVIKSAMQEISVQASEAPLEASEIQDAILYLNRLMASLAADGINLGYTSVSDLGDIITVPSGATGPIVALLAASMWSQYSEPGVQLDFALAARADDGRKTLLNLSLDSIGPTLYPDTLPIGSGNEIDLGSGQDHFYGALDAEILQEQGGTISVETGTELP
jgi:hypothetical protein